MAPAIRCSHGWERGSENNHKRGHSLESGLTLKTRDDDLLLFNEMQSRERNNFLLHTADDFDESLSKLRNFSNLKLGINIPTTGANNDLLNMEGDKNDYDWLLTPPDTPLFSSLDDEYSQPLSIAPRSRARSQPIMTSRLMAEKSCQTTRTSSSPHRLCPSPRSSGTSVQMRGRPILAPRSSPPPVIRSTTPIRRPSTPPNKQPTRAPRSSTPTLRRDNISSSIHSSNYGGRGLSPVNVRRGKSASPKLPDWQISLPGFTSEAPPNLRTSLSDRQMSNTRGSSPASRNGSESSERLGRKSMSPTSSRSISSSLSQERDRFSSYSKHSSDEYEESLRSITMGISRSTLCRKDGVLGSHKSMPFSRKPSKNSPANCVPKRSFDSALRLMDQRKTPQNMFRPLLSSVPANTFRPIFSRNSSLTTSSNASSEQGAISVAFDMESSELEPPNLPDGWEKTEDSETHEEVFAFDKVDEILKETSHEVLSRSPQERDKKFGEIIAKNLDSEDIHNLTVHIGIETSATFESAQLTDNCCDIDGDTVMTICSKCGKKILFLDVTETINFCQDCVEEGRICTEGVNLAYVPLTIVASQMEETTMSTSGNGLLNSELPEFHVGNAKIILHQHEKSNILGSDSLHNICFTQILDQRESVLSNQHLDRKKVVDINENSSICTPQLSNHGVSSSLNVCIPESNGSSILLMQRSDSSKGPILQGKTVSATNFLCSEFSYSRDNINASRRSTEIHSPSISQLVDLGPSRQTKTSIEHQLCRKGDADNLRTDTDSSVQSMSLHDISNNCYESRRLKSEREETYSTIKCLGYNPLKEIVLVSEEHAMDQTNFSAMPSSSSSSVISDNYLPQNTETCRAISVGDQQMLDRQGNDDFSCSLAVEIMSNCISSSHAVKYTQNESNFQTVQGEIDISGCSELRDDYFQNDKFDEATKSSSILLELQHGFSEPMDHQNEFISFHCSGYPEQSNGHSLSETSVSGISFSSSEPVTSFKEHGNHEKSCTTVELPREHTSKNSTSEEATNATLFNSSVSHELAYNAVTNAMEKELNLLPDSQAPASTLTSLNDSEKMPCKHILRPQMFKRKRIESQTRSPTEESEIDVNVDEFMAPNVEITEKIDTVKPPKMESKCNCTVM